MGSLWALVTAFCEGVLQFESGRRSRQMPAEIVTGVVGFFTACLFLVSRIYLKGFSSIENVDIAYGSYIGIIIAVASVSLCKALARGPIGLVSVVGGLAVLVPLLFDCLRGLWPTPLQISGIIIILIGLYFVTSKTKTQELVKTFSLSTLFIASCSAALFGFKDVLLKLGESGHILDVILVGQCVKTLVILFYAIARRISIPELPSKVWIVFFTLGLFNAVGWFAFVEAAKSGMIDIASSLAYLAPLITVVLAFFFLRERLVKKQVAGFIVAIFGTLLVI